MALELVYTSATRGLRPGTSGFCTVAMTRGFPPALVPRLEALGGYRPGPSGSGPVARCFWRVETASGIAHVLAKVGPASPDHTARTNKIASYLVLSAEELAPAGPAWLLAQPGLLRDTWSGEPQWIEQPVAVPAGRAPAAKACGAWAAAGGDAGWAGVLASAFLRDQARPVHVIVRDGIDPLPLVDDALGLLPDWARWRASFSTHFLQPVAGTPCAWRFCLDGTPAADAARQSKGLVIDLARNPGAAPDSRFTRRARTGIDEEAQPGHAAPPRAAPRRPAPVGGDDFEIGLAPDPGAPESRRSAAPRAVRNAEPTPDASARQPIRPVVVGVVAAVLTLLLLLVLVLLTVDRGSGTAAAEEAPAPKPAPPGGARAPEPRGDVPGPSTGDASVPPRDVVVPPREEASPRDAVNEPASEDARTRTVSGDRPADPPSGTTEPPPDAVPAAAPVATPPPDERAAPQAGEPSGAEPVAAGPVNWAVPIEQVPGDGPFRLRGRLELPASAAGVRFVLASMPGEGAAADAAGRIEFGSDRIRASVGLDKRYLVFEAVASGPVPPALAAALDPQPGNAPSALRAVLDRALVEVVDRSGAVLGHAQLRAVRTAPIDVRRRDEKVRPVELAVDRGPVVIQVVAPRKGVAPVTATVAAGERRSIMVARRVVVELDRSGGPSVLRIAANVRPRDEVVAERSMLAARLNELNEVLGACSSVEAYVKGGARPTDLDLRRAAIDRALSDEARARLAAGPSDATERDALAALVAAVQPLASGEHARVAEDLREANAAAEDDAAEPRRVRAWGKEGILLLDASLPVPRRGGRQ